MTGQQILTVALALEGGTDENIIRETLRAEGLTERQISLCLQAGKITKGGADKAAKVISTSGL